MRGWAGPAGPACQMWRWTVPGLSARWAKRHMSPAEVLDFASESVLVIAKVAGPVMLIALFVGLVVSLFQALTQIQEMTLTFVPKIVAMFVSLILFLPFMGSVLGTFMERVAARIANLGGAG